MPDFTERRNVKGLILLSRHIPDIVRIPVRTELFQTRAVVFAMALFLYKVVILFLTSLSVVYGHIIYSHGNFVNNFLFPLVTFCIDFIQYRCYSLVKELQGGELMTQGERVKAVRDKKQMTMEQFGEKLGVTKTAISRIEKGDRSLTEQMLKSICREFSVNEDWLRTGAGGPDNMFIPEDMRYLNSVGKLGNEQNEFKKFCINMLMDLPDKYWDYIYEEFKKFEKEKEE